MQNYSYRTEKFEDEAYQLHRTDGPAVIKYKTLQDKEIIVEEIFLEQGSKHNLKGPAHIKYDDDGNKIKEVYYMDNVRTRDLAIHGYGPTETEWHERYKSEYYILDGLMHRANGPAFIEYQDGKIVCWEYHRCGLIHRSDAPAKYMRMGNKLNYYYFNEGECVSPKSKKEKNVEYYKWLTKNGYLDLDERGILKKQKISKSGLMMRKLQIGF